MLPPLWMGQHPVNPAVTAATTPEAVRYLNRLPKATNVFACTRDSGHAMVGHRAVRKESIVPVENMTTVAACVDMETVRLTPSTALGQSATLTLLQPEPATVTETQIGLKVNTRSRTSTSTVMVLSGGIPNPLLLVTPLIFLMLLTLNNPKRLHPVNGSPPPLSFDIQVD